MLEQPNQVLVIDDDEAAREILVELLGRIGFHAFAAADGKAGLEWLAGAAAPPQAVLLDLRMPVLDGFDVLARYRAEGGTAPVIALSAMDEKEAVVKASGAGLTALGRVRLAGATAELDGTAFWLSNFFFSSSVPDQ